MSKAISTIKNEFIWKVGFAIGIRNYLYKIIQSFIETSEQWISYEFGAVQNSCDDACDEGGAVELSHVRRDRHEGVGDRAVLMNHVYKRIKAW